jgi:ferric-dicitrate binding protein FerR (iron transport regulator)
MEKLYSLFKVAEWIAKEKSGNLSEPEKEQLQYWLNENEQNKAVYERLQDEDVLVNELKELEKLDKEKAFQRIEKIIAESKPKSIKLFPKYLKYAAAIAAIAVGSYFIIHKNIEPAKQDVAQVVINPGIQKAILVTDNGNEIQLDSSGIKQIVKDDMANVVQSGSTLSYIQVDSPSTKQVTVAYNTLITPRGGEYKLIMSDGTEVLLNSGSKLRYPMVFNGNSREVELEGEAFFKVAKMQEKNFVVKTDKVNVTVYGTVFDVFAYDNDDKVRTTLVEGSVGVSINGNTTNKGVKIKPGQQFSYDKSNGNNQTQEVDVERYVAWTKGMFVFEDESIESILRDLSRWYDFDYEFKDESLKNQRFTINLGRYSNASRILEMISASSNLKFQLQEKKIIVDMK